MRKEDRERDRDGKKENNIEGIERKWKTEKSRGEIDKKSNRMIVKKGRMRESEREREKVIHVKQRDIKSAKL